MFIAAKPYQVTIELATSILQDRLYASQKRLNELDKEEPTRLYEFYLNELENTNKALNGALGNGKIEDTIGYFNDCAKFWRDQEKGGKGDEHAQWRNIAPNMETAARLFENSKIINRFTVNEN